MSNIPVYSVKYGCITAVIHKSFSRYFTTISRIYSDIDGTLNTTNSFEVEDLLLVSKLIDQCHTKIMELKEADTTDFKVIGPLED
jgi:hypothetical protein